MKRNTSVLLIFCSVVLFAFAGCATKNLTWHQLTPKGKAALALGLYNDAYDSYLVDVKRPNLSKESKELLRKKKQVLTKLAKAITVYTRYVQAGSIPPDDVENVLLELLSQVSVK